MKTASKIPEPLVQGERARLFPVLADTSKEGRTLSIFLACLENIDEFGRAMLSEVGVRVGTRTRIEAYTEVILKVSGDKKLRPDGLIVLESGSKRWSALIEAKVGGNEISSQQLDSYLDIAKSNKIDSVITISNQFTSAASVHPVDISAVSKKKAALFHWS